MVLRLGTTARRIDVAARKLLVTGPDGAEDQIASPGEQRRSGQQRAGHAIMAGMAELREIIRLVE